MSRRLLSRILGATGAAGALWLLLAPAARAADVFQNIAPASPFGAGAIFDRYPIDRYEIDQHFTAISASLTGGVNVDGLLPMIAYFFASELWHLTAAVAKGLINLFGFAFNLDLVNGSSATGGAGALGPVSQAIHSIYANVFGAPWLVLAFSGVAIWAMWKALVQRRYSETAGALALSILYIVVAVFFVAEPGQTIGRASAATNEMSQAFLSISRHGSPGNGEEATADDADQLWSLLIEKPWAVLEFGGLEHCTKDGTGDEDHDPVSVAVRPLSRDSAQNGVLYKQLAEGTEVAAEGKTCINNANKYSSHFLRFDSGSDERNEEYDALQHGDAEKLPEADDEKAGYKLGVADKPATDAMEMGGQSQRLWLSLLIAFAELGAFLLLGALSLQVILSQVLLLLLLAFSPVALVAAAVPGRGHDFFKSWLQKLAGYLLRKASYSLVLAVLLAVNAAIAAATSPLGWLFSFGLQASFFWAVLIQRRSLASGIAGIVTGRGPEGNNTALDAAALYGGARLGRGTVRRGLRTAIGAGRLTIGAGRLTGRAVRWGWRRHESRRPLTNERPESETRKPEPEPETRKPEPETRKPETGPVVVVRHRPRPIQGTAVPPPSSEPVAKTGDREGRLAGSPGEAGPKPAKASGGTEATAPTASSEEAGAGAAGGSKEQVKGPLFRPRPGSGKGHESGVRTEGAEGPRAGMRTGRGRSDARLDRPEARAGGETGGQEAPATPEGSDLSEELRTERERASRRPDPAQPGGQGDDRQAEDGGSDQPVERGPDRPSPERPNSPPRRRGRLRRLWRRRI